MILEIVAIYSLIGLISAFTGPLARDLKAEIDDLNHSGAEQNWQLAAFRTVMSGAIILLWPILLFSILRSGPRNSTRYSLIRNREIAELMNAMASEGIDGDEFSEGEGEFGLSAKNPIPTRAITGSMAYLSRLATFDGENVSYERRGSCLSQVSNGMVDIYDISNNKGEYLTTLYLSPYNRRNSKRAPVGYNLKDQK